MSQGVTESELLTEDAVLRRVQEARSDERMEDVPDVYQRPYDPKRPVICVDEKPVALFRMRRLDYHPVVPEMFC